MIIKNEFPILEYDDENEALINPTYLQSRYGVLPIDMLVITFFKDALDRLIEEGKIEKYLTIEGENNLDLYKFTDDDVFIIHGAVGCPACGGYLDDLIGIGIKKVMFCGGGVLDKNIKVGELLAVEGAIRDEGFSYHYVKPSRIIYIQKDVFEVMTKYLDDNGIPYLKGLAWTTDAFYRETKERIKLRKEEGAKIVEMEQAGLIAVTQFRNVKYGALLYGGDDVSQDVWDGREWNKRGSIRYNLIELCKELVKRI